MKKLHFIFKLFLAFFLFGFIVWYQTWQYNLALAIFLGFLLYRENIRLFRFPRQGYMFAFLLLLIFMFQTIGAYGKILLTLPFGITITDTGIYNGFLFITQILLIFLLFGAAIYSTERREVLYYYQRLSKKEGWFSGFATLLRIAIYVMYLLPKALAFRQQISKEMKKNSQERPSSINARLQAVLDSIYRFILAILQRSEAEYVQFKRSIMKKDYFLPPALPNSRHILVALGILVIHVPLIWNF